MHPRDTCFYGAATVGAKGQIVIPVEARDELGIKSGDKVFVISLKDKKMLGVFPAASMEAFVEEMTNRLTNIKEALDKGKKE